MIKYFNQFLRYNFIIVACVSCIKARQHGNKAQQNEEVATFSVGRVSGSSKIAERGLWSLPNSAQYDFNTCFQDNATLSTVRGNDFSIVTLEGEMQARSNSEGCIVWTELVPFDPLAKAHYLKLERKIIGKGTQRGQKTLAIAVNPWDLFQGAQTGNQILDLRYETLPSGQLVDASQVKAAMAGELDQDADKGVLLLGPLGLTVQQIGSSGQNPKVAFGLTTSPSLILKDRFGKEYPLNLSSGEIELELYLVARSEVLINDKKQMVETLLTDISKPPVAKGQFENSNYKARAEFTLKALTNSGELRILIRATPILGPLSLQTFEGEYSLGDGTNFGNSTNGILLRSNATKDRTFKLDSALAEISKHVKAESGPDAIPKTTLATLAPQGTSSNGEVLKPSEAAEANISIEPNRNTEVTSTSQDSNETNLNQTLAVDSGVRLLEAFNFGFFTFQFSGFEAGESTNFRTSVYKIRTLIKNSINGSPILLEKFKVKKTNGSIIEVATNDSGLLEWSENISYKYYDGEQFFEKSITLNHKSGFAKTISFYINPWDNGSTFGFDKRAGQNSVILNLNASKKTSAQITMNDFSYQSQNLKYDVDQFLNMSVKKGMIFTLSPKAIRYNSLSKGRAAIEDLRDGVYVLKMALQKSYLEQNNKKTEFLSVVEKLVRVSQGKINTLVEFKVRDLRLMRTRLNLLIEIAPVDETKFKLNDLSSLTLPKGLKSINEVIDKKSDLKPRTFVGPLIPGLNSANGVLRPTDNLEENLCQIADCNTLGAKPVIENASYSDSLKAQFNQDIKSLAQLTVTKLVSRWKLSEINYLAAMKKSGRLARLAGENNLEVTQAQKPEVLKAKITNSELKAINKIFVAENPIGSLYTKLNKKIALGQKGNLREATIAEITSLARQGIMSEVVGRRFCDLFVNNLLFGDVSAQGLIIKNQFGKKRESILKTCLLDFVKSGANSVFSFERRIKSHTLSSFDEGPGRWINLTVGTGVDIRYTEAATESLAKSDSFDFSRTLFEIVGNSIKQFPLIGAVLGGLSMSVTQNRVTSQMKSQTNGATLNAGISLVSQQKTLQLILSKYELCTAIRMNWNFIDKVKLVSTIKPRLEPQQIFEWVSRGILLCSGLVEQKPVSIQENYYYFTQYFNGGDMLDDADLKNNPWLLMLRGRQDYVKLLSAMEVKATEYDRSSQRMQAAGPEKISNSVDMAYEADSRLSKAYRNLGPTYPGYYLLTDESNLK